MFTNKNANWRRSIVFVFLPIADLEFQPNWGSKQMPHGVGEFYGLAVAVGYHSVEVEVTAPGGSVEEDGYCENGESSQFASFLSRLESPLFAEGVEAEGRRDNEEGQPG